MKKRYLLQLEIETEINDELKITTCREDDVEKVRAFHAELIKDDTAILEYFKNWCIFHFIHMKTEDLVTLFDIKIHDDTLAGPAAKCSPKVAEFINLMLVKDADGQVDIDRLDSILNLIDSQFKIARVVEGNFEEIKPEQGD
jgi:hypothetical protein